MTSKYSEILIYDPVSSNGAKPLFKEKAFNFLNDLELEFPKIEKDSDFFLLHLSKRNRNKIEPLICLRCKVSYSIYAYVKKIYIENKPFHDLDLSDLLSYLLIDDGSPRISLSNSTDDINQKLVKSDINWNTLETFYQSKGKISRIGLDIIYTWNPKMSNLSTWGRTKAQGDTAFRKYLRGMGILIIRDWALLADSTTTRVRQSWRRFGDNKLATEDEIVALHSSYLARYKEVRSLFILKNGRNKKWEPDEAFLQSLEPPQKSFDLLLSIVKAIRLYLSNTKAPRRFADGEEQNLPSDLLNNKDQSSDLKDLLVETLEKCALDLITSEIEEEKRKWIEKPKREKGWRLYCDGLSQRDISKTLDISQTSVSRIIPEKKISELIAQETSIKLSKMNEFANLRKDPMALVIFIKAIVNYLLTSELEGDIPLLRQWILKVINS